MGCRGIQTGLRLWEKLKNIDSQLYCTDHWKAYKNFIPKDKHMQSKKLTWLIENLNGRVRHYLARFHRKTKCSSKSLEMVSRPDTSLKLFVNQGKEVAKTKKKA